MNFLIQLFLAQMFMPHGFCYLWDPWLILLHVVSDSLIALAYFSIAITLLYFVRLRKDLQFNWVFLSFAIFIVACGATHLMEIWNIWHPTYWLSGIIKGVTAVASVFTAIALLWLIPQALALPSRRLLDEATRRLEKEILQRQMVQQSEERFRTLANSIPQLTWIGKADGFIYWYNQRWYEFTGTTPEQMEGWGWQSVHDPLVLPEVLVQWKASIATGQPFEMVLPLRRADGVYCAFLTRCLPLKDADGQIVQWLGTNTDVTELKRAEDALREREEQLRLCVEHSPTAIVMLDREMRYLVVSRRWMEAYRLGEQSIVGRSHYEVMSDIPQRWIEILQRCLAGAIEKCDEDPFLRTDGRTDWVRWEVRPWRQADGAIGGIIIFSENISERKLAQEEILRLNADLEARVIERTTQLHAANVALDDKNIELQKTAEAKDSFLANMSHELRTPLNGIIGFAEFLVDGKPGAVNPKQKEYLEDILNSGKHLLQLISDILDLAKVGVGKMEFYPERFSLRKVIEETCAVSNPIAQKRGIHINVEVAPEIGEVTLDQQKFKQVLFNLLSNAIKFSHDGDKVEISAELLDAERVKLVVSDTGIGIKAGDVGRLFKEFEQLESGATRHYQGTGLGLALTRKIVELQGGNISVDSQLGKGSNFIVVLPLVHNQGQPTVLVLTTISASTSYLRHF
jgi:PAS domain S-box-containing protein